MNSKRDPRPSARPAAGVTRDASLEVGQLTADLSRLMNSHDATRLVLGLLYLSRTAHVDSRLSAAPTWPWLLHQAAKEEAPIRRAVTQSLAHWLPPTDIDGNGTGMRDAMPYLPPNVEAPLRRLIQAIGAARQVGDLLDQCLLNLSAAQAHGSHYFTPQGIARLMVGVAAPQDGHKVLDPVCGSGGLLVESHRYVSERVGVNPAMVLLGKEQHAHTSQVARMNLAVRGIDAHVFPPGDSLAEPETVPYDIVLANLPFNQPAWAPKDRQDHPLVDPRWLDELPPKGSANSAWILHIAHALSTQGRAAFLMADIAAKSPQPAARRLRERLVRDDVVECVITLPPRVFGHTEATAGLWVLNRDKSARPGWGSTDRRRQVLFINARRDFELIPASRTRRLGDRHSNRILAALARWRGLPESGSADIPHRDEPDWSRSCTTEEIAHRLYDLMPTTYTAKPPEHTSSTGSRVYELKRELVEMLEEGHALEPRLLDALEEI